MTTPALSRAPRPLRGECCPGHRLLGGVMGRRAGLAHWPCSALQVRTGSQGWGRGGSRPRRVSPRGQGRQEGGCFWLLDPPSQAEQSTARSWGDREVSVTSSGLSRVPTLIADRFVLGHRLSETALQVRGIRKWAAYVGSVRAKTGGGTVSQSSRNPGRGLQAPRRPREPAPDAPGTRPPAWQASSCVTPHAPRGL